MHSVFCFYLELPTLKLRRAGLTESFVPEMELPARPLMLIGCTAAKVAREAMAFALLQTQFLLPRLAGFWVVAEYLGFWDFAWIMGCHVANWVFLGDMSNPDLVVPWGWWWIRLSIHDLLSSGLGLACWGWEDLCTRVLITESVAPSIPYYLNDLINQWRFQIYYHSCPIFLFF